MIALVVVLAVALADAAMPSVAVSWPTPEFLAALATLIVAITGLFALFKKTNDTKEVVDDTHQTVHQVAAQTNGVVQSLQDRLTFLEHELDGTSHRAAGRSPSGATGSPTPPLAPPK